ncbi:MAG: hypothetical protein PF588_05380 [Candidatus Kapabacteria bacterium]|jgi:hypothetical protein|nr:hypothetical protein [Candidatus Kapabacteria bacterium]
MTKKTNIMRLLIVALAAVFLINSSTQSAPKDSTELVTMYSPEYVLKVNFYDIFSIDETSDVVRTLEDGTEETYTREVTYFIRHLVKNLPDEGFQSIKISIDSMRYKLTDGSKSYEFNSQANDYPSKYTREFKMYSALLGAEYVITYSPYGDLAKVETDALDKSAKEILESKFSIIRKFYLLSGMTQPRSEYLSDLKKLALPNGEVAEDSVWECSMNFHLSSIAWSGKAKVHVSDYNVGNMTIRADIESMETKQGNCGFYDVSKLATINKSKASGSYEIVLTPRGALHRADGQFDIEIEASVNDLKFKETIKTKLQIKHIKQLRL